MGGTSFRSIRPKCVFAYIVLTGASVLAIGCVNVPVSRESADKVRSIRIDPTITVPANPDVDGAVNVAANLLQGLLVGASPLPRQVGASFHRFMDANDVKIEEIVLRSFRRNLKIQDHFELNEDAEVTIELVVLSYGFKMPAFDITKNQRRPELLIEATLRSSDSTVLWRKREILMRWSDSTQAHPIWALWKNPRLVERSLEQASCIVAYRLLTDLRPALQRSTEEAPDGPICDPVVQIESRVECAPGVGCVHHKTETWEFKPSRIPVESNCNSDVGCSGE
jgi:hypothetical protein